MVKPFVALCRWLWARFGSLPTPSAVDEDWGAIQKRYHCMVARRALFGAVLLCMAGSLVFTKGVRPTQSDIDAQILRAPHRAKPFRPPYAVSRQITESVDMPRLHRDLLPAWVMSLQHSPHTLGRRNAEMTFEALKEEAGKDPNLALLLDELHEKIMYGLPELSTDIHALFAGWNEYMARVGAPWRLEHHIAQTASGSRIFVRSYRAVADVEVTIARAPYRVLLLSRADRTNLVEGFIGQTSWEHDAALVVLDRVVDFAADRLWPLFDGEHGSSRADSIGDSITDHVLTEALGALGMSTVAELARTGSLHRELEEELASVRRRNGCGASVLIDQVPWDGLSPRALALLNDVAVRNEQRRCPRLMTQDARRFELLSARLRDDAELEPALGRLAAWLTRAVAVHEARHLANDRGQVEKDRLCGGCPSALTRSEQSEVSAYLASFAAPGLGYVALMQACGVDLSVRGTNTTALAWVLPKLLDEGCAGAVPDDLYQRAQQLEREVLGSSDRTELSAAFPDFVPVPRALRPSESGDAEERSTSRRR